MGRKRKDGDPFGLVGTRLALDGGKFFYRHRATNGAPERWELLGTDVAAAKKRAALYNDPSGKYGTVAHWFGLFLVDMAALVKAGKRSQRTLDDYTGYCADDGPLVTYFGAMLPEQIEPNHVQAYVNEGAKLGRPVPANRERACLSSMLSWLLRRDDCPAGLRVNPCMRQSGVQRNTESKRELYVEHAWYRATYEAANAKVQLMMELVYRTLQRPEVDVLAWTPANVRKKAGHKVLTFRQSKTQRSIDIALTGQLGELVAAAIGDVPVLHQPIVHTLKGEAYTYDGLSAMLKQAQARVRATVPALKDMPSFGFRDLKGKGATDMYFIARVPIEQIQLLCGHADKKTTEIYIKARWRETAAPNDIQVLA